MRGKSTTYDCRGVDNAEALRLALGEGWHRTLPEAVDPPKPPEPFTISAVEILPESEAHNHVTPGDIEEAALTSPFLPPAITSSPEDITHSDPDAPLLARVEPVLHTEENAPLTPAAVNAALARADFGPEDSAEMRIAVANVAPTRAELDAEAKTLGLHLNKRTSDADLAKRIADTKARVPHLSAKD